MAYWIESDTGELINLDRMDRIFCNDSYLKVYGNKEVLQGPAVLCEGEYSIQCIASFDSVEAAQEFLADLFLKYLKE